MLRRPLFLVLSVALAGPAAAQTVDEIIARSVEARGGLEKLQAVRTVRMKGTLSAGPMEMPMLVEVKRPASFRSEMTFQGAPVIQASDGRQAWGLRPGAKRPEVLPKRAAEQLSAQADVEGALVNYAAKGHRVELLGREKDGERTLYRIKVTLKSGETEVYLVDAGSWLPVRVEAVRTVDTPEGPTKVEGQTVLGDYREVGGWKWPYLLENSVRGKDEQQQRQRIVFEKIEVNPEIPDSRFEMPAQGAQ